MSEQKNNGVGGTAGPSEKTVHIVQPAPAAAPLPGMPQPMPAAPPQGAPAAAKTIVLGGAGSAAGTPQPTPQGSHAAATVIARPAGAGAPAAGQPGAPARDQSGMGAMPSAPGTDVDAAMVLGSAAPRPGMRINQYEVIRELGA